MSRPDSASDNFRHTLTPANVRRTLLLKPSFTSQLNDRLELNSPVAIDHLIRLAAEMISGAIPDPSLKPSIDDDSALAEKIADRPRWRDRPPSEKQNPRDFFLSHYPDALTLQLTWVALRRHDPQLCSCLQVYRNRNRSEHIPLLTKRQAIIARIEAKRRAGAPVSIAEMERAARVLKRKNLKLASSRS